MKNKGHRLQGMKKLLDNGMKKKGKELCLKPSLVWDFNQHIEPMDMEHGSEKMKSPEKIEEKDVDAQKEMKKVKMEIDDEKEYPKVYLDIVPREDVAEDVESLSTNSKNYKIFSEMLEDFDRQDVEELYRLVKERYNASRPEGFDLML
ncbi:hypothetical protein Tco_1388303 [Tanacetum coccineum]